MYFVKKKNNLNYLEDSNIVANELEIILTQKCNLSCKHCMRGDAKKVTISKETLNAIFSEFVGVMNLSLGGGEPSLAPDAINDLVDVLTEKDTFIPSVNFTLNGTVFSQEFADAVKRLQDFVVNMREVTQYKPGNDEDTPIIFCFSLDKYHMEEFERLGLSEDDILKNILKYKEQFPDCNFVLRDGSNYSVINEGRAKSLIDEIPKVAQPTPIYPIFNGITKIIGGVIVISSEGEFVPVNTSFENEQTLSAGNINTQSIKDILSHVKTKTFTDTKAFTDFEKKELIRKYFVSKNEIKKYFKKSENKRVYNHIAELQEQIDNYQKS